MAPKGKRMFDYAQAKRVGLALKRLRVKRRLSLRRVAPLLGRPPQYVLQIEKGLTELRVTDLLRLAAIYHIPITELIELFHNG